MDNEPLLAPAKSESLTRFVDYRRRTASRSSSGGWTSALFIIGVEIAERFAYYGISLNLISYLTGPLGEGTAAAAAAINTWSGVASMLPLLGAFVADTWLGRYRTIVIASLVYILALGMLTVSTILPPNYSSGCSTNTRNQQTCPPSTLQTSFFYLSLYLVAFAQGGHKPCVQAFGADQFDQTDPDERLAKSSFFNWWYLGICAGGGVSVFVMSYVQDNISWGIGYGVPCAVMLLALVVFLLGTRTYRYYVLVEEEENPFVRIGRSFVALVGSWKLRKSHISLNDVGEENEERKNPDEEKAEPSGLQIQKEEAEARALLQLFPIWSTCLIYGIFFAQIPTFFTKQASTLDRRIGPNFQVPSAALQVFISFSIISFIPMYDKILVPVARKITNNPSGITMLQRIGTGIALSLLTMVIAALVEIRRLKMAEISGLVDKPKVPIPMSLWWMVPQYLLFGIADVFTVVGMQEFFYDQMPDALRSLGLALYLSVLGVGSFISSLLIYVIDRVTSKAGETWFMNNLNRAHLDYFYWILAGLGGFELLLFVYFAKGYVYKKRVSGEEGE